MNEGGGGIRGKGNKRRNKREKRRGKEEGREGCVRKDGHR